MSAPKESAYALAARVFDAHWDAHVTPDGRPFALDRGTGRATMLSAGGRGVMYGLLQAAIVADDGKPGRADDVAQVLVAQHALGIAGKLPVVELHLRAARPRPDQVVLDLGESATSRCVVVTPRGWKVKASPPRGVHFQRSRASRPLPVPARGDGHKALRNLLGWKKRDRRWRIVRGWLAAALLPDVARPLLFAVGRQGSGKTAAGTFIASVLDPRDELGGSLGKNERDALVSAGARYIASWDNLTTVSTETSNFLCRLVTGGTDERRSLYSDEDLHSRSLRRTGMLTALTLPLLEPDALDRIVPIAFDAIAPERRRSEQQMKAQFDESHPAILGGVLDDLAVILRELPKTQATKRSRPRLADYSDALYALDPRLDSAFCSAAAALVTDAALDDPFVRAVAEWLSLRASQGHLPMKLTQRQALDDLRQVTLAGRALGDHGWLPSREDALTRALTRASAQLESLGFTATRGKHTERGRLWVYDRSAGAQR